ncbi:Hypothetical predicted protein [Octopus vulgaris]|uniref:Uncharacterized protein n=1 Tax=Octopus vulgaris TaxID=6645 RepID=A0AA36AH88_OCTVU|nr:Hypothetical predicted protein [Octopus vulgaris]
MPFFYLSRKRMNQVRAGTLTKTWGKLYPASSAPEVKEAENESGVQNILETTPFPTKYAVLQSLDANEMEMWVRHDEETTEQCPEENNGHEISNSDSSHSSESNVNGQEHSNEEIWDNTEKSMEIMIKFLERNPYFNDNYVLQAMFLRKDMIIKRLQHQEIVEFRDRLRNVMATPVSSTNEDGNESEETHSINE